MKISLEQTYPILGNVEKNLLKILEKIDTAIENEADIVIFPELALTGYCMEDLVFDVALKEIPPILVEKSEKIDIVVGMAELGEEEYPYNTAYYLSDGKIIHKHRKVFLPDYGLFSEGRYFMSGKFIKAFDTRFGRMGILICEDAWHQSAGYLLAQDGAKFILNISNSPARLSGEKESLSKNWEVLIKASSLASGIFNIVVNRVGIEDGITFWGKSFVVSPYGEIIKEGNYLEEESILCDIDVGMIKRARISSPAFKIEDINLVMDTLKRIKKSRD